MNVKSFYTSNFFRCLADSLISPFIPVFALLLGATKVLIGLISTLTTLAGLFPQIFWGTLNESMGKKNILIIFGFVAWALMWIPIALVKTPVQLLFLLTVQSLLSAAATPAWTSLFIHITPSYRRAYMASNLDLIGSAGSFIGTLVGGFILNSLGFVPFLFYMVAFLGIISILPFIWTKESATFYYNGMSLTSLLKRTFDFSSIGHEKELVKMIVAITFLNFSVNLVAPFLSVYIVTGLRGNLMNIAIISLIDVLAAIVFYRSWVATVDNSGKKFIMLACIIPISFIPFIYAITPSINWLYAYEVVGKMSWIGFNLAAFAYLASILPKDRMSSSIAVYNLFVGLGSAAGPFVGGILGDTIGLQRLLIISTAMRFSTIFLLDRLEEKKQIKTGGAFGLGFKPFGLAYRIENFVDVYSFVLIETLKRSIKLLDVKNHFKRRRLFK